MFKGTAPHQTPPLDHDKHVLIETMIEKYGHGLTSSTNHTSQPQQPDSGAIVLLTGSTGNLGSDLLAFLCSDANVTKIYTLNRRSSKQSIFQRHTEQLNSKSVDAGFLKSEKIVFLQGDTALPNFDLDLNVYQEVY